MRVVVPLVIFLTNFTTLSLAVQHSFEDWVKPLFKARREALIQDYLYRGKNPYATKDRCATPLAKVVRRQRIERKSTKGRCFSSSFLDDPQCYGLDQSLETSHFVLFYTTQGTHAVNPQDQNPSNGVPDYIDRAAQYAEQSYDFIVAQLGYQKPPTTTSHPRTSIYFINTGAFGWTDFGFFEGDDEGPSALMAIHHTMEGLRENDDPEGSVLGALKVTIVHEFFHAVKASYDWWEDLDFGFFWDEATSTWVEDELFPQVNDYLWYLCYSFSDCGGWLARPTTPLNSPSPGLHRYGGSLFARFLTEPHKYFSSFSRDIIRKTWECAAEVTGGNSLECIDRTLQFEGTTLAETYAAFMQAVFLKDFADGNHPKFENVMTPKASSLDHMSTAYIVPGVPVSSAQVVGDPFNFVAKAFVAGGITTGNRSELFWLNGIPSCVNAISTEGSYKVITVSNTTMSTDHLAFEAFPGKASAELSPPSNLRHTVLEPTGYIQLNWSSVNQARSYAVYRSANQGPFSLLREGIIETTFVDSNLSSGITYFYVVRAQDDQGKLSCPSQLASSKAITQDAIIKARPSAAPNPVASGKSIKLTLEVGSSLGKISGSELVTVAFYTPRGRKIQSRFVSCGIFNGTMSCPINQINLSNGVYFYSIEVNTVMGPLRKIGKLIVLR